LWGAARNVGDVGRKVLDFKVGVTSKSPKKRKHKVGFCNEAEADGTGWVEAERKIEFWECCAEEKYGGRKCFGSVCSSKAIATFVV